MRNNKVLAFLAFVFVAFFSYWTFNQIKTYQDKTEPKSFENLPDTSSTSTENTNEEDKTPQENEAQNTVVSENPSVQSNELSVWVATDYKYGDIKKGDYTVKSGDTLWEIAEAVYGNGSQWTNILQANSSGIGYLPNGQQALIFPGQVIFIP